MMKPTISETQPAWCPGNKKPGLLFEQRTGQKSFADMNDTTLDAKRASKNSSPEQKRYTESDYIEQFRSAMREKGIETGDELIADGRIHRFHVEGDRKGSRNGWAILHLDGRPAGAFGCARRYGIGAKFTWSAERQAQKLTPAERRAYRERIEKQKREREAEEQARREAAAARAKQIWDAAQDATEHPYLKRKGIRSHGLRVGVWEKVNPETGEVRIISKNALLVPIWGPGKVIHSLQAIFPSKVLGDRDKDYLKDGAKEGLFYSIGKPLQVDGRPVILVCEGFATGASLHECTGHAVIVAFDAPNLLPVAKVIRERFPDAIIVMAADNDQWTVRPVENPGVTRAREAAAAIGGLVAIPPFDAALGTVGEKGGPTDFNDLHVREGMDAVRAVIDAALAQARPARVVLVPTPNEALGAAYALECLARLADAVANKGGAAGAGFSTEIRRELYVPYADAGIQRAAELARAAYPGTALAILAAPGDEAEAERVATLHGATVDLPPADGSWRGWGEHFLDELFARIDAKADADPAAREFSEQAIAQASAGQAARAGGRASGADEGDPEDDTAPGENPFANNRHFRVLGVDEDAYFFFRKGRRNQILTIRTSGLSKNALLSLAPMNWWEGVMLDAPSGKFDKDAAVGFLMEAAEAAGIYDPTFTRGRGAWWDEGRLVVHLGDRLLVDGTSMELGAIRSEFLYQGGRKIAAPSDTPLSAADGAWLLEMAKSFRWAKPASAPLLCGWLLLSPLCGALHWRPHAWITGGPGSGKTTILNEFVRPLIPAGMDVFANGDSTEAGLRQTLRSDARPILIDESESDTEAAATKMQRILVMIRQSSSDTGAQTYRGTVGGEAQAFQVRSMALLSSIGVALERQQDLERVTVLALRPKREGEATDVKNWPAIRAGLNKIAKDKTLSARLFRRSIDMAPVIMESIDVFTEAAATFFGTAREGDQIGALLAGAWCLVNDRLPTPDEALAEIKRYDWGDYQEGKAEEQDDLIATLMGRPITRQGGMRTSVGKLIARAAGYSVDELEIDPAVADSELHNFGMKVQGDRLLVHPRNPELVKLMRETKFASDLRGRLKRIEGTDTGSGGGIRIGEANTNGLRIPLLALLSHRAGGEEEPETF
ncbi:toprim domain-containing protein [Burkholderia multivorans]|uniref:toprim domain-containing protein n=1 Tax=Burkholderia multivorans TaxID=87883 RepID=UPI0012DEE1A0|nr:toprim domain-containing protein [Burkholderia multivorans]MBU9233222.1 toprim domain-containing protein [Burkholderia multivorans]QGR95066.1 toprim domain-containing protein [Burkholderia multivorans]HEF4735532.1 toprim domain-containing protein [Burkholderia multivorans]